MQKTKTCSEENIVARAICSDARILTDLDRLFILFCSEFPLIPRKWWRKEEGEKQLRSVLLFKQRNNGFTYMFQTDFFEVKKLNFLVTLFARLGSFESIS